MTAKKPIVHGTHAAYVRGCRCERCTRANAEKSKQYRNSPVFNTGQPATPVFKPAQICYGEDFLE